jgi:ubiquitin carboxyl-terminal hydrolase 5/13
METIQAYLERNPTCCRVATPHDPVFNSECCYTFHTPFSAQVGGILVNLDTFTGTVESMSMLYGPETSLFVRIVKQRVLKSPENEADGLHKVVPTKLAIGVEGGFLGSDDDKYEIISKHSVVALKKSPSEGQPVFVAELPYDDDSRSTFPAALQKSVDSVLNHVGVSTQQDVQAWQADDEIPVSKYAADLIFVENEVLIDPNPHNWKCEKTGSTENLWLNLSDGYIGGGRKNWDVRIISFVSVLRCFARWLVTNLGSRHCWDLSRQGSGGSNGALDHYQETGKLYPLVVKLGTITADVDTADCYSYAADEDGPVKVPNLAQLLEKRGIKVTSMYVLCNRQRCSRFGCLPYFVTHMTHELNVDHLQAEDSKVDC